MTAYRPYLNRDGSQAVGDPGHRKRFDRAKAKLCGRTICDEPVFRTGGGKLVFFDRHSREWTECSNQYDEAT